MKFGKVENPETVDFSLPPDAPRTSQILSGGKSDALFEAYVGCTKWNRTELKGFYPRGTKDELPYYATQFNSIELNATFYQMPDWEQVETWAAKTPPGFRFFPKITGTISHYKRLVDVKTLVDDFANAISNFGDKLGMSFLQLHENFKPRDLGRLEKVLDEFPKGVPLGVEVRNSEWFSGETFERFCSLLERNNMANIVVDSAGRRDIIHMRLTSPVAFIRYVGANHSSDTARLDDWIERIAQWRKQGLQNLYFFVHQNIELESPLLASHFIVELNQRLGTKLQVPMRQPVQKSIFD